jgi:uncharacterized protein with von Willebrand factor type A (vWA) domain
MATARARRVHKPGLPAKVEQPASAPALDIFLKHYSKSGNEREARHVARLTRKDLDQARADLPEFDEKCREVEADLKEKLEERLFVIARDDPATLRWTLERMFPEKYGNKQRLDINVRDVTKLSDEELERYIAQCQGTSKR